MRCLGSLAIRCFGHHLNIAPSVQRILYLLAINGMVIGQDDAYDRHCTVPPFLCCRLVAQRATAG